MVVAATKRKLGVDDKLTMAKIELPHTIDSVIYNPQNTIMDLAKSSNYRAVTMTSARLC